MPRGVRTPGFEGIFVPAMHGRSLRTFMTFEAIPQARRGVRKATMHPDALASGQRLQHIRGCRRQRAKRPRSCCISLRWTLLRGRLCARSPVVVCATRIGYPAVESVPRDEIELGRRHTAMTVTERDGFMSPFIIQCGSTSERGPSGLPCGVSMAGQNSIGADVTDHRVACVDVDRSFLQRGALAER
jgi:hypothetical protein